MRRATAPIIFMNKLLSQLFVIVILSFWGMNFAYAANSAPQITTQPSNKTVTAPATATFTITASGTPTPTYQWKQEVSGGSSFTTISGATSASYTTPATSASNNGTKFECVATNSVGSATSNAATLTVNVKPSITTQPSSQTVTAPATATFSVVASGLPSPTYQWQQEVSGGTSYTTISGATSASYTTPATTSANNGIKFECIITNVAGNVTSSAATLTVNVAPSITTQPANATVTAPAKATFTIVANGLPAPTYQWKQEAPGAGSFSTISGATSASYTTPATAIANSGTLYECVATNSVGSATSNVAILIVSPIAPSITTQPSNQTVTAPATATFTVVAGGRPSPTYQWQQEASGAGSYSAISGATSASYTTPATTVSNSGTKYECVVSNSVGNVTSTAATLTVNPPPLPVVSITSPSNNSSFTTGSSLTITASASESGGTISSVSFYNGATLLGTSSFSPYSYTITSLSAGNYILTAKATDANNNSTTSSPITVTVNGPSAAITAPTNNSTFNAGSSLTITANASETNGTISSVSFYNGATLLGTSTSSPYSYTINALSVGNYAFAVQATDANGSTAWSSTVTVTVTGQPAVTIASPANNSTYTTGSINITATATENYGTISSVSFYKGSSLLGTVTSKSSGFTYTWNNVPAGTYNITAIATDILGATATSSPISFTINTSAFSLAVDDNILSKTDPRGNTTSYQYDNLNRLLKITFADNSTVSYGYDLFGNQTSVTDQRNNKLTKIYDAYERLFQTKDPLNGITQFNYDTNGDLLTLTDANNHTTTYTYDGDYRVLTQTNALNFTTTFTYDPVGNVASRNNANNITTKYYYDTLNHLTNIAYPDGTLVTNTYDGLGHKTTMTDVTGFTTYTYDALSHLLNKTSPGANNAITYTYDSEGNRLTSVDQNNRTITNTYDTLNRLASVNDPNGTTNYGYDADSNENLVTLPNGVTESYTYDTLNRVLTDVNAKGSTVISSFTNVYDVAGMITKKTLQDNSWTAYSYDMLNRLLEETKQTNSGITYDYVYTYDPVGNRLTWTKNTTLGGFWSVDYLNMPPQVLTNMTSAGYGNTANPTQTLTLARSYNYDVANRLSNWNYASNIYTASFPIQTDTYTYDNNGNRLTKQAVLTGQTGTPQQTTYSYDFENRLNQLNYVNIPGITGNQTDNLAYNGEGLRTQAVLNNVTSAYSYDGMNILVERDGSGNTTKSYTRGLDFGGGIGSLINQNYTNSGNAVTQYYDYNDLGSLAETTTTTGTAANSYSYDAFGNLLTPQSGSDTNRYLFSSKELDSRSGLQYFGARYYDPEIGRWLTPDPLGLKIGPKVVKYAKKVGAPFSNNPFVNLYSYVNNNPINYIDAWGLLGEQFKNTGEGGYGGASAGPGEFGGIPGLGGSRADWEIMTDWINNTFSPPDVESCPLERQEPSNNSEYSQVYVISQGDLQNTNDLPY